MNISSWLPFCLLIMLSSVSLPRNASRISFLLATFAWSAFISNRGFHGPDTHIYQQFLTADSGLGLWIHFLSITSQLLGISLVNLHAAVYWLASLSIALLPFRLFRCLVIGWSLYFALGGFVSDTSTIRWSFCFLFLNALFAVLVISRCKPQRALLILAGIMLLLGFLGYPSVVLFLLPPIIFEILILLSTWKPKILLKLNKRKSAYLILAIPMLFLAIVFAFSVISRYLSDILFFYDFVGIDLSLAKILLSISSALCIAISSKELIKVASSNIPPVGATVFVMLFLVLAMVLLSSMAVRLAPIFTSILVMYRFLRSSSGSSSALLSAKLPGIFRLALFILVPMVYVYSQSYVAQSLSEPYPIGSYYFP